MEIQRATLSSCHQATDLVVAIDVLRAFTTAAYLFHGGVEEILLVSGVQEAFRLRTEMPDCLIVGEVDGIQVQGFDFGNSPSEILDRNLIGKRIIQRTSAGTQGVVLASQAKTILTAALTNASSTVRYIQKLSPRSVTFIQTGLLPGDGWGDEDVACADAMEDLLFERAVDWDRITKRVRSSPTGHHFDGMHSSFPPMDLELALKVDCFTFAMVVERKNDLHVMHCIEA
jgi:2-phosphosulfolactate phosphatase